jgi:neutral ceramidase
MVFANVIRPRMLPGYRPAVPVTGWRSPLAPFLDLDRGRARFEVATRRPVALPEIGELLAGVAEVDITPPPGLPKAGYSANAHDGVGFRTRLRARVFHLRSGRTSIAIVACDLLGGSSVLQRLVADAVAERTDIPLAGIMVGATHTHAGPGQFLGTDFYNRFASNRSGFDPAWAQFLVDRIAGAVVEAHDTRRPARIAVGTTEVWGWTRNRSLDPHVHNADVTDRRTDPQRKWVSINPELHLLRVDAADGDREPLGALVVFSVHGTGISMHTKEYNADLWAYLVGDLDRRIEIDAGRRSTVGAIEGTHADVAPAIRPGRAGHVEAQRIGRGIGEEAHGLWRRLEAALGDRVALGCGLRELDLEASRSIDGIELPRRPAVGAALVAGATENVTPVIWRMRPFKAGAPKRRGTRNPQGAKWVIGTRWLQGVVLPLRSFPRVIPVQLLRIGDGTIVGLPFEITTETGRRVAAAVGDHTIVSSVANEYSGYVATAEEYSRQYYEGGHTLYGPNTQRFLAAHAARLAHEVGADSTVTDVQATRRWNLKISRYLPRAIASAARRAQLRPSRFVDPTATSDGYWEMIWRDVPPGDLDWHEPIVRVEHLDERGHWVSTTGALGRAVTDQGWELEVQHCRRDEHGDRYIVRWYEPEHRAGRPHRFVLEANAGRPELATDPFD